MLVDVAVDGARRDQLARACRARRSAPLSSTTISSASEIVESRCAMMIVVRPRITSRRPCLICASVVASTDAVASSRISTRGSTIERARDRDPLALASRERDPALADHRVVAVRKPLDELAAPARARRRARSPRRSRRRRRTRCSRARVAEKRNGSCETTPIARRSDAIVTSRTSTPSSRTLPSADVVEASDERGERRLAGARVADQRGRAARLELEVDPCRTGRPGAYSKCTPR